MADPAGTIYRLALNCGHASGASIINLFTFQALTTLHTANELANDFVTGLVNSSPAYWKECNLNVTTLQNLTIDTWPVETTTVPAPLVVSAGLPVTGIQAYTSGLAPPVVLAQHAILRTAISGRSFRGRLYFGPCTLYSDAPITTRSNDGWRWGPTAVAKFQAFLDACLARYDHDDPAAKWAWGVWSRRLGGNLRSGRYVNTPPYHVAGFTPIVSATAMAGIRTQKRREAPRGV